MGKAGEVVVADRPTDRVDRDEAVAARDAVAVQRAGRAGHLVVGEGADLGVGRTGAAADHDELARNVRLGELSAEIAAAPGPSGQRVADAGMAEDGRSSGGEGVCK